MNPDNLITALYRSNTTAKAILDEIAKLPKQAETLIEPLSERLGIDRRSVVTAFKTLDRLGAGEFIPGRRGHPSRFQWHIDSIKINAPESQPLPVIPEETGISHTFRLRPDLTIGFTLPEDITAAEAQRLGAFLLSLPFGS